MRRITDSPLLSMLFVLTLLAILAFLVSGCGIGMDKATERFRDAPRGDTNSGPADVITFPDGFSNLAAKCEGPNRVYVAFKADDNRAAVAVAPNDPRCTR